MQKSSIKYLVTGIVFTLIIFIGVTYAFWKANIQGAGKEFTLELGSTKIIFNDNQNISTTRITPGWSTSKTFTIENQGTEPFKYDIYIKDLINTLVTEGFLQYKITSANGYNMEDYESIDKSAEASNFDLAENINIDGETTHEYTLEIRYFNSPDIDQSEDMGKMISGQLMIRENAGLTLFKLLSDGSKYEVGTRTNFSTPFGGETLTQGYNQTGKIYKVDTEYDSGTITDYYFAGNPSDNWVLFAGFWWRIIRSNSSEGTRLLYAGEYTTEETLHGSDTQNGYINNTTYVWNSNTSKVENNSWSNASFTSVLSDWYKINIEDKGYSNMVNENTVYCNDPNGSNGRLVTNKTPSYICTANNNLTHKNVGLITADEVAYAGGVIDNKAPNTYYYRNAKTSGCIESSNDTCSITGTYNWWTMSIYNANNGNPIIFHVNSTNNYPGQLNYGFVSSSFALRPVITLKSNVKVIGEGTVEKPFEVNPH